MKSVYFTIICLLFLNCFAKESLIDKPVELANSKGCNLNEYCEKYIQDIDIENFIKEETKKDYVFISLDECLDVALKNNFDIDIAYHEYKSAKYEYHNALSYFMPILNTTSYISDYQGQILVGEVLSEKFHETAFSVNITAQHNLTRGGADIFEAKAKNYFQKAKNHTYNFSRKQTLYECAKSYYELLLNKIYITIYLRNLIERNAQLTLAQSRQKSGFGTSFDVSRSLSESEYAKAKLLDILYKFKTSQSKLADIMGIDVNTSIMPFENDVKRLNLVDTDKVSIEDLFKLAISYREDIKSYKAKIMYEKEEKNVLVTDFIPKPYINYQQQFQGTFSTDIKPNYILSAFIEWKPGENLALGTISKIKAQKEKINAMKKDFENKIRDIEVSIVNNYSSSIFSKRAIDITKKRVEYGLESIKLATLRFKYGKGILLDVIQAQSEMTQARTEYVESIIKYNIAQISLIYESGTIEKDKIVENYKP